VGRTLAATLQYFISVRFDWRHYNSGTSVCSAKGTLLR